MTVGDLDRRMGIGEFHEWMAFYGISPFGEERSDIRAGIIASTIANVNRPKGQSAFGVQDFMPFADRDDEIVPQTPQDTRRAISNLFGSIGLRVEKHDPVQS